MSCRYHIRIHSFGRTASGCNSLRSEITSHSIEHYVHYVHYVQTSAQNAPVQQNQYFQSLRLVIGHCLRFDLFDIMTP